MKIQCLGIQYHGMKTLQLSSLIPSLRIKRNTKNETIEKVGQLEITRKTEVTSRETEVITRETEAITRAIDEDAVEISAEEDSVVDTDAMNELLGKSKSRPRLRANTPTLKQTAHHQNRYKHLLNQNPLLCQFGRRAMHGQHQRNHVL